MTDLAFAAIADDFTGAADLASMLVRGGLRTTLAVGVEGLEAIRSSATDEAVVVALKTRSIEARLAVKASLEAVEALQQLGAQSVYFKYCSTFDSTPQGNIGPVAQALREKLKAPVVPFVPSFPENGRCVYRGHLFVSDNLLSESGMERHPLNPMRDPNLVRVLGAQSRLPVRLINWDVVHRGPAAVKAALENCTGADQPLVILDAIHDDDLRCLATALQGLPLLTGGSALALHVARHHVQRSGMDRAPSSRLNARAGRCAVIAGSCSRRTREQISHFLTQYPGLRLPLDDLSRDQQVVRRTREGSNLGHTATVNTVLHWFDAQRADSPSLVYSTDLSGNAGSPSLSQQIERALAAIAQGLVARGFTRLIIAGGETSGAVVAALQVRALKIGPEIAPGVPWTQVMGGGPAEGVCLALKSGNFGAPDMFITAFEHLQTMGEAA